MMPNTDQPAEAADRAIPEHWEGDLILGTAGRSDIGTIVERASPYITVVHLPRDRTAEAVRDGLIESLGDLPESLRRSLTGDRGAEMSEHRSFRMATDMHVYFCDPRRTMATRHQRRSQRASTAILPEGHQSIAAQRRRPPSRC
jgi:IS30 family transposase